MNLRKLLHAKRLRRKNRNSARIFGLSIRPRLAIHRSNRFISAQLIDDEKQITIAHASSKEGNIQGAHKTKTELAIMVGEVIARKAAVLNIRTAIFDRRAYRYHGRVKALAEGARKGGLQF